MGLQYLVREEKTNANATYTIPSLTSSKRHQVAVDVMDATVGTVSVSFRSIGAGSYEPMLDRFGAQVVIDLAAPRTHSIEGCIESFQFVQAGVDDSYQIILSGTD